MASISTSGEQESKQETLKKLQEKKADLEKKIKKQREDREKSLDDLSVGFNKRKQELEKRDSELSQKVKDELAPPEEDSAATPEQLLAYMEADVAETGLCLKSLKEDIAHAKEYIKEHKQQEEANIEELNETLVRRTKAKKNYDERKKKEMEKKKEKEIEKKEKGEKKKKKTVYANPDSDESWNAPPEPVKKQKPSKIPRFVESPPKAQERY